MATKNVNFIYRVTINRSESGADYYHPKVETRVVTEQSARAIKKNNEKAREYTKLYAPPHKAVPVVTFERAPVGEFEKVTDF